MNKIIKYSAIAIGAYCGLKYYKASKILQGAGFAYDGLFFVNTDLKNLTLGVRIKARATAQLNLGSLNLNLYCNGVKVGKLYLPYQQDLQKGEVTLIFYCDVNIEYFARTFATFILNKQVILAVEGTLWYGGLPLSFPRLQVLTTDLNDVYSNYIQGNIIPYNAIQGISEETEQKVLGYAIGEKDFYKKGFSSDIITACKNVLYSTYYQTKPIAEDLNEEVATYYYDDEAHALPMNDEAKCLVLFKFCVDNFTYKLDPQGEQLIKTPSRFLSDKVGDCKSFAIFICSVLTNLGIPCVMRFVDYGEGDWRHVYAVAKIEGQDMPLDVVAKMLKDTEVGEELEYVRKKDVESKKKELIYNVI